MFIFLKDFNLEVSIQFSENNVQYMKIMENTANNQNYTPDSPEKVAYQAELFVDFLNKDKYAAEPAVWRDTASLPARFAALPRTGLPVSPSAE